METKKRITVDAYVKAPIDEVWKRWTTPEDIIHWNNASDDWHTLNVKSDLRTGGEFLYRMEAKDGSTGFDFSGVYDRIKMKDSIVYTMGDGRKVEVNFVRNGTDTKVIETFEAESQNPIEKQRDGWQSILDNFKNYTERKI